MTHGSLFSGIGGFDLAAEWMGWENKFHCEWNEFGQRVLKHYWPNAESFTDITKTDFKHYANRIDILTGGFPCQPYSLAGKRKGKEDERHLWPEMLRAIREIQPRWVVGENVFGLINWSNGLVFHEVQVDLETAGYEVWPYVLPACAVNAPHRRDRVWFIAYLQSGGCIKSQKFNGRAKHQQDNWEKVRYTTTANGEKSNASNPNGSRNTPPECRTNGNGQAQSSEWEQSQHEYSGLGNKGNATNPNSNGQHRGNSEHEINASEGREYAQRDIEQVTMHTYNKRLERRQDNGKVRAIWQESHKQPSRHFCTTWQNFPTQSPICTGNDGLPTELDGITFPKWRNESIKAAGNAIVPQLALQIFKTIEQYEQL